jgi:hypothetical protein
LIARHLAFIHLFSGQFSELNWQILTVVPRSFTHGVPFVLFANYSHSVKKPIFGKCDFFGINGDLLPIKRDIVWLIDMATLNRTKSFKLYERNKRET